MPRKSRTAVAIAEPTLPISEPAATLPESQGTADESPAFSKEAPSSAAPRDVSEQGSQSAVSRFVDPRSRHTINLGDGRAMRLFRSQRLHQAAIMFIGPEGADPQPEEEDRQWLEDHHWKSRQDENVWTRQINWKSTPARQMSDWELQDEFAELANRIRERNGLEPIDHDFRRGNSRTPF